jgi:transcription elongation factor
VPWSQRKSAYSAPAANKGRKTTAVNRHDNDREDEVPTTQRGSSSSAPASNKRQKTAAASQDAIPTPSASSVATADKGSKQKLTPATAAVTTASRRKKTA